jgi:hypothetical protein
MNAAPSSFYEAILHGLAGNVTGRRLLFLFVVDQSEAMRQPLGQTSQSRLETVTQGLNEMIGAMARIDNGPTTHFDLGFIGYGLEDEGSGIDTMWAGEGAESERFVREVGRVSEPGPTGYIVCKPPVPDTDEHVLKALDVAADVAASWTERNPNPIFKPIVIHVLSGDKPELPGLVAAVDRLKNVADPFLFHCCLVDYCRDSVILPDHYNVPSGICQQLYDLSSEMPPLMVDIGQLLKGNVTPRLRQLAEDLAQAHGLPRALGSLATSALGAVLGRRGISLPTGSFGRTRQLQVELQVVGGLTIDSSRGFALVRDLIGFRIFTRLCN